MASWAIDCMMFGPRMRQRVWGSVTDERVCIHIDRTGGSSIGSVFRFWNDAGVGSTYEIVEGMLEYWRIVGWYMLGSVSLCKWIYMPHTCSSHVSCRIQVDYAIWYIGLRYQHWKLLWLFVYLAKVNITERLYGTSRTRKTRNMQGLK